LLQGNASTARLQRAGGLIGQGSVSFSGLHGAETFVYKPDCNGSDFSSEVMESGTVGLQGPQTAHFPIFSVGETPTDKVMTIKLLVILFSYHTST
jgi:hypothetical protein